MNVWLNGLQVGVIGMAVVFAGLVLLIVIISLIKSFSGQEKAPAAKPAQAAPAPLAAPVQAAPAVLQGDDPQVVAAITAALSVVLSQQQAAPSGGFIVRRIRRV